MGLTIEYRGIRQLPTCIGNERIRITADGHVSHSRNTVECDDGAIWSADWRDVGRLDDTALARLRDQIAGSGLLKQPPELVDEVVEGGTREELDLAIDEREYHFVVQNTDAPAFRAVITLLWGILFSLDA